ncbi:MAG: hypothetical protein ACE14V_11730 [bacterium]
MPKTKYTKPNNLVSFYYSEKELIPILAKVVKQLHPTLTLAKCTKTAEQILDGISSELGATNIHIIAEQFPLLSMQARGKSGNVIYQVVNKTGTQYARKHVMTPDKQTAGQILQRDKLIAANYSWRTLSESEQNKYNNRAKKLQMSGYNLFLSEYMKK